MTTSELRELYQAGKLRSARVCLDTLSLGWLVTFYDDEGNQFELTDTLGCRVSYESPKAAEDKVHQVADCPTRVDSLYRFFEV